MLAIFVHRPLAILLIGLVVLALDPLDRLRHGRQRRARPPVALTALGWVLFAAWETLVMLVTPEADIRVDLLLIWPLLLGCTAASLVTSLWPQRSDR